MQLFREPKYLIYMILAVGFLLVSAYFAYRRKKALSAIIMESNLLERLTPPETAFLKRVKTVLFIFAVSLIFIALAMPQWGVRFTSVESRVGQAIIALDASLSMLASDIKPDRMENAKMMFKVLIDRFQGYRMGIIAFSNKPYVQCPVTTDTEALKYFISKVFAGSLPTQGTSLSAPVKLAVDMLADYPGQKALILLTDGEDHNEKELGNVLKQAKKAGIVIFTIGIASPKGGLIPLDGGKYKLDGKNNPVVSRLGEDTLIKMAAETEGAYIRYSNVNTVIDELTGQLENLTKTGWRGRIRRVYKNRYQIPLFMAVILLLLDLVIPDRKFKLWRKK